MRHSAFTWIWDNIEAFAVAIALALVIRHFCIEAFRIPTDSMRPTLHGDDFQRRRHGDRILVDKTIWELRDPRRFEVAVFRYPLNTNKNFIKRIVGLPGEWVRLADGDVWTSVDRGATWKIARKPAAVREELLFPYWPDSLDDPEAFREGPAWEASGGFRIADSGEFLVESAAGESGLRFLPPVHPYDSDGHRGYREKGIVGDVRVTFTVQGSGGALLLHLVEHGRDHLLHLGTAESYVEFAGDPLRRLPLATRLREGEEIDVSFANIDDMIIVDLPEDGIFEIEDSESGDRYPTEASLAAGEAKGSHAIYFEAAPGLSARISDVRIDRDVFYDADNNGGFGRETWEVPEGHYFMLGDNTLHSSDSRKWTVNARSWRTGPPSNGRRAARRATRPRPSPTEGRAPS
ncbi:MAG: signal peptidase I [Planctomycetes bacterium]|nr:signal peptidase I [Planctomycetota bacterium]